MLVIGDAGMATFDHTPRGRGYHTSLSYFHHANDYWTMKGTGSCDNREIVDLWVAEEDGYEGPAHGYNSICSANHNRTDGTGCAAGRLGAQTDHGYEDALFAARVQRIIQAHFEANLTDTVPLFVCWAPHNVHTSLMVPKPYLDKFDFMQPTDKPGAVWSHDPINLTKTPREGHTRQLYSAMVNYADTKLGEVIDLLKLRGFYNSSLILFSTDNVNILLCWLRHVTIFAVTRLYAFVGRCDLWKW